MTSPSPLRGRLTLCSVLLLGRWLALPADAADAPTSAPFALRDGDRVLFSGDSITDQNLYNTYVESFVLTRFPSLQVSFRHAGWGGDSVGGVGGGKIDLRLQRDVIPYHPTVLTIMLGMNDGRYKALDPATLSTYVAGYTHILDIVQPALPGLHTYLIQPSAYDDVTRAPLFTGGYNAVLVRFAQEVAALARSHHCEVVDFNTPVVNALTQAKALDGILAPKLIPDRVHPGPAIHLVMAAALLEAWNAPGMVTNVEIDAAQMRVPHSDYTHVALLEGADGLVWDQQDERLPMPMNLEDGSIALADRAAGLSSRLNRETLKVSGLAGGRYSLQIDGVAVGTFAAGDLAAGLNLALLNTPMTRQADAVLLLALKHNRLHTVRWRAVEVGTAEITTEPVNKLRGQLLDEMDAEEGDLVRDERARAQPVTHHYELVATGT